MSVRRTIHETEGIYFITFTCARWLKLFELTNSYDLVDQKLDYIHENACKGENPLVESPEDY